MVGTEMNEKSGTNDTLNFTMKINISVIKSLFFSICREWDLQKDLGRDPIEVLTGDSKYYWDLNRYPYE